MIRQPTQLLTRVTFKRSLSRSLHQDAMDSILDLQLAQRDAGRAPRRVFIAGAAAPAAHGDSSEHFEFTCLIALGAVRAASGLHAIMLR